MKKIILSLFVVIATYLAGSAQNCNDPVFSINESFTLDADNTSFISENLPDCWSRAYPQGSNDQGVRIRRNSDGNGAFLQVASGNGSGGDNGIALMPTPENYLGQLSFRSKTSSGSAVFDIEVVLYSGGRNVRVLRTFGVNGGWQNFSIDLGNLLDGFVATGNEVSLGFRHTDANKNFTYRMDIDDVVYTSAPCINPVFSVVEDFSTNAGALPECWTRHAHETNNADQSDASIQSQELWITNINIWEVTLPETTNLRGIISFDAEQEIVSGGNLVFAVVASDGDGNYTELTTFTLSNQMQTYSYDLSLANYSGSYTRIGLRGADGSNRFARAILDNLDYRSECSSNPAVNAVAQDITITLDENDEAVITAEDVDDGSSDICGNLATISLDKTQFGCADLGDNTVTLTATIGSRTATATATVRVIPDLPAASERVDVYLDASGNLTITPDDVVETSSCSGITYTLDTNGKTNFTCGDVNATLAASLTATFDGTDTETSNFFVVARDTISPTAIAQDITVQLDASGNAIVSAASVDNGSSDGCSSNLTFTLSRSTFGCADVGDNPVELTVSDANGNTASAPLTVTVESSFTSYNVSSSATGSTCVDGSSTYDITLDGSDVGVRYSLRDTIDNSTIAGPIVGTGNPLTFNTGILAKTTTYEVVAQPEPTTGTGLAFIPNGDRALVSRGWDFNYGSGYTFEAVIQGNTKPATGTQNVIFSIGSGTDSDIEAYFQGGTGLLVIAHERGSNSSAVFERFIVPTTNVKFHFAVTYDPSATPAVQVYYDGVLENKFDGFIGNTLAPSSGQRFKIGDVDHSAFGTNGVADMTIDEIRVWDAARTQADIQADMDGCVESTSTGLKHYYRLDEASGTSLFDDAGSLNLFLNDLDGQSNWVIGFVACESECQVAMANEVTIGDTDAPVAVFKNLTLSITADGSAILDPGDLDNGSTDGCSGASGLIFSSEATNFSCADLGDTTIVVTVADAAGNEATATTTITIVDDTAPVINQNNRDFSTIPPTPVARKIFYLDQLNTVQISIDDLLSTVEDNCDSDPVITLSQSSFSCTDIGEERLTITATDAEGNVSTGVEVIEIIDATIPVAVGQDVTIQLDNTGNVVLAPEDVNTTSSDNCTATADLVLELSKSTFDCTNLGINIVSFYATDASGNVGTASISVTVEDTIAPVIITQDITVELDANDQVTIAPADIDNGTSDNCSFTLSLDKTSFVRADLGDNTVTLTATDPSGNTSTSTAVVTVQEPRDAQSISFAVATVVSYGQQPIAMTATATSGLPVSFTVTGEGELLAGDLLKINGAGTITVVASQAGDANFSPAADVTYTITSNKAPLVATAEDLTITYGTNQRLQFSVMFKGFVGDDNALDIDQTPSAGSAGTTLSDAGAYPIIVSGGTDDNYNFTYVNGVFNIEKASQKLTFPVLSDVDIAISTLVTLSASSDAGLPITYSLVSGAGIANLSGNEITLSGTGQIIIEANQVGTNNYNSATPVQQTFEATDSRKQDQVITLTSIDNVSYGDAPISLNASASSGLAVTYSYIDGPATLAGNVVTITGAGTINIEVNQEGDNSFNPAPSIVQSIMVAQAPLQIVADDKSIIYGDDLPFLTNSFLGFVNGEGQDALSSIISLTTTATVSSNAGMYPIEIMITSGANEENYLLTGVDATLTIEKADQVITVDPIEDKLVIDLPFDIVASVDSNLPLDYVVTGPATIAGTTISLSGAAGTVEVTVSQIGTNNFNAAVDVVVTFDIAEVLSAVIDLATISVYPNPSSHFVEINTSSDAAIRFYALDGTLALMYEKTKGKLDISTLERGVYMVELIIDDERIIQKFIKAN